MNTDKKLDEDFSKKVKHGYEKWLEIDHEKDREWNNLRNQDLEEDEFNKLYTNLVLKYGDLYELVHQDDLDDEQFSEKYNEIIERYSK